jgi:prepilin signal peptidase PulO-like enzyme (type II secretory pathway)
MSTAQSLIHNRIKIKKIESLLHHLSFITLLLLAVSLTSAGQGFQCRPPYSVRVPLYVTGIYSGEIVICWT